MALASFDAITTGRRWFAGLVYLVPWALSFLSGIINSTSLRFSTSLSSPISIIVLPYLAFLIVVLIVQRSAKKPSRFVRFHTMQSVLLIGIVTVVATILGIIATLQQSAADYYLNLYDGVSPTSSLSQSYLDQSSQFSDQMQTTTNVAMWLYILVSIVVLVLIVGAFLGKYAKLPLLAKLAEKFADTGRVAVVK